MTDEHRRSHLPEGAREHTHLIYDPESGEVVHGHTTIVFPGADSPSPEEVEQRALEEAARATNRDAASLSALAVEHEDLEHGAHYRVDPKSKRLERITPQKPA
jgi:hypothetical protein